MKKRKCYSPEEAISKLLLWKLDVYDILAGAEHQECSQFFSALESIVIVPQKI